MKQSSSGIGSTKTTEWHADVPVQKKPTILKTYFINGIKFYKALKSDGKVATFLADLFDKTWNTVKTNMKPKYSKRGYTKGENPNSYNELMYDNE